MIVTNDSNVPSVALATSSHFLKMAQYVADLPTEAPSKVQKEAIADAVITPNQQTSGPVDTPSAPNRKQISASPSVNGDQSPSLDPLRQRTKELIAAENFVEAENCCRQMLTVRESDPEVHDLLGSTLQHQRKMADAEQHFKRASLLNSANAAYRNNYGYVLYLQRKYAEAETVFEEAVRLDPENANYQHNLGNALYCQKEFTEAEVYYRSAVRLEPKNWEFLESIKKVRQKKSFLTRLLELFTRR